MHSAKGILHLSSTSGPGGAEMIVKRLATGLDPKRFRSVVCLFKSGWLAESCEQAGLPTYVVNINGAFDIRWATDFANLLKKEGVALIHAHEFTANVYGTLIGKLAGIPVLATVHGKNYYGDQLKRRMAYRFVARTGRMIAVSNDLKRFMYEKVGIPDCRVTVIYNGVEKWSPPDDHRIVSVRSELALSGWEHVIGSVGSLYPVKGHIHLIRAMPAIVRAYPKTVALLVGRGELEGDLKAEACRLGVEKNVRFLGFRDDIPLLLGLMDVFALPSLSEGLSMALLEAMGAGLPVVASRVGGNSELIEDGQAGFLVPAEDSAALADRVLTLFRRRDMAQAYGQYGRRLVEQRFSSKGMLNAYQDCYSEALGLGGKPPYGHDLSE